MSSRRPSASINDIHLPPDVIKGYDMNGLRELSNQDDVAFYEFFQGLDLEEVKQAQQRRERIQEQNRELAVKTCEQKPRFEEIKSELRRQSTEVDELRESYASKYEQLKTFQKLRDDNAIKTKLTRAMKDAENKSDNMASDFIAGKSDLSVDDFKDQFLELRQAYWTRKVKSDKLDELLKNQRPTPAPRGARTPVTPTQPQSLAAQNPAQSLPAHLQPSQAPYPVAEPRRGSQPTPPPPYAGPGRVSMPGVPPPGHPFSSMPPGYQPGYPMTRPPPPRPSSHNSYTPYAHRY